ncbi:MAG: hypothetical protein UV39_C0026G0007, partial [Candidatus Azambacteria bacterium GW2011_GWA2_42_62]
LKDLRSKWFKIDRQEAVKKLIKLFYDGLLISFEAAFSLSNWASRRSEWLRISDLGVERINFLNHFCLDKKAKNIYLNIFNDWRVFTDFARTPAQALELSINSCREVEIKLGRYSKVIDFCVVFQPLELAAIYLGFISEKGLLSDNLRKNTFSNLEEAPVFRPKIFQEKIKMINEIIEIYNNKRVADTSGKGWHFGNGSFQNSFEHKTIKKKILVFWLKQKFWRAINAAIKI